MKAALLILIFTSQAFGLETDNYIVWNRNLKDASPHIDRFFSESMRERLGLTPHHEEYNCEEMTEEITRQFESRLVHDNPVENWLFDVLSDEEIYPRDLRYVEESIYRDPYRFYIPWFGLAPNIQVNGFYFGTDKLSHFASTGMIYFRIYHRELKKGLSSSEALRKAINWGVNDEKTLHGFWASGVFSYADLEANYQGLRFYLDLCEKNHLKLSGNRWILESMPRIADYIGPSWDESYEESFRKPTNWEKVSQVLKNEYCPLRNDPEVRNRMKYYDRSFKRSFSQNYLASLELPSPRKFREICPDSM